MAEYHYWECCVCGSRQGMSEEAHRIFRKTNATFYCVLGHPNHYPAGKPREQQLREQVEQERRARARAEQQVAMWQDVARDAEAKAKQERARANGYKGHATRITKRAKSGVCPCCNRTFKALAQHMATKHPDFTPIDVEQVPA